jgi:hypothetical protein
MCWEIPAAASAEIIAGSWHFVFAEARTTRMMWI